ncbi:acetylgalactosaminidase [Adhaeribacter arboris]|uniref:Acetylgalactosaminidase n=1 Tax=Adhaeribacter arboris TaxID=2072846 RepID=A0A2T2YL66_9BACT|nr:Gfo/Idh/MocA family oxidoreductase [Adhaeribacter arboris]PSR56240.1 acetylgalactosaminidase [Adhaeribacter arboris]
MKDNRRDFLKFTGLVGAGLLTGLATPTVSSAKVLGNLEPAPPRNQKFNMSGYGAPKLETVRMGFIGLGQRGPGHAYRSSKVEGVQITALCDIRPEKVSAVKEKLGANHNPAMYSGKENEWKKLCERKDVDLVYISTPWHLHAPMAVYAMEQGKHVAIEVPGVITLDECWQLVETSEKTKKHCMYLENCCYDFFELLTLNMARQGFFGDIIHGEGAYIHNLMELNFKKDGYYDMWRLKQNASRNGNLYPGHGLGPVAQVMDINRGDKMDYLVAMSSNDFMMGPKAKELAATDDFFKPYANKSFRGNMNTTTIRTAKGRSIMLQHDVSSPRVYSRIQLISGTKGAAQKYPLPGKVSVGHKDWLTEQEMKDLEAKYQPPIVKKVGELAKQVGGHGGMDFLMNWRLVDCLRNGLPLDIDVYDAAAWSAIGPLSEQSVAKRSNSVDIPDFTNGSWKNNKPVDVLLAQGGNTNVKL